MKGAGKRRAPSGPIHPPPAKVLFNSCGEQVCHTKNNMFEKKMLILSLHVSFMLHVKHLLYSNIAESLAESAHSFTGEAF